MVDTSLAMNEGINPNRLFILSCVGLCVTAMTFAIRAGMLNDLGAEFSLTKAQLGWTASMAFFGFPAATVIGGLLYNAIGPRLIMIVAFLGHIIGLVLTIFAGGFWGLMISTFCVGFANGSVEAACNPMIANMYSKNKTTMLNKFHVWFPGGIVVGSLAALMVKNLFGGDGVVRQDKSDLTDTAKNLSALASPLFIFICVLMTVTATTELGTQQWVGSLLESSGANPLVILALVTGLMAVGRYFAGPLVHALRYDLSSSYRLCYWRLLFLADYGWLCRRVFTKNGSAWHVYCWRCWYDGARYVAAYHRRLA